MFFYKFSYTFYNISVNIITLISLCKCIKCENVDINFCTYAYQFQCNILVYGVKNNKIV